ncbi:MAG: glycosyltransferase family 2 protein [Xanthomonadales bacterium]|nr:glycosyltransferase family 2 protein [Gammaproteobacteria bacterium]NNL96403.1 glycosyltransferase family 2 protein [Xanthomonadales bacterium]
MKVCGFCIVKDAVKYDYPVVEAISSILPLCDKVIVSVGDCDDGTRELIAGIGDEKIEIVDSVWDSTLKKGGKVLSAETNKVLDIVPGEYHWIFNIQADEVVHERYWPEIRQSMKTNLDDRKIDGLIFRYRHFFGTYDYVADSRRWYRHEIRVVRNDSSIRSWNDAQGFRKRDGSKIRGVSSGGEIYHYGWVRPPKLMKEKVDGAKNYWSSSSKHIRVMDQEGEVFVYENAYDSLSRFRGTHPAVMQDRVARIDWRPDLSTQTKRMSLRHRMLYWIEKKFGLRLFENRHFIECKGK